ncbi:helix-turn-helix domain-containing protein [Breoghania corrubedonensis]|nr:helix-turn-helix domain-containing protein [Breoghania corrubedonensis]
MPIPFAGDIDYDHPMTHIQAIPQFHLFGEAPDDTAFDFIHVETLAARSARHGWTISLHNHRHLNHILVIRSGGGVIRVEDEETAFRGPAVLCVAATVVHGFAFEENIDGHIATFTEDVVSGARDAAGSVRDRLRALFADPVLPLEPGGVAEGIARHMAALAEELDLARDGHQIAMRAHLMLMILEIGRARTSRTRYAQVTLRGMDETVSALRDLIEDNFRTTRRIGDYADRLGMTSERLNEHCKRVTGVTVGHMIRQRLITEAKRQLLFTDLAASEIAYDLAFADPSHFSRFFRNHTGMSPQEFRKGNEQR